MNSNTDSIENDQEQLIADFKVVMDDAEALLKATAHQGDAKVDALRAKATESLRKVGAQMAASQAKLVANGKKAVAATDFYVHENPWAALGVAGGIGLVLGLLLRRH